jgi:D-3-phosphoglycerate dehydrogenase
MSTKKILITTSSFGTDDPGVLQKLKEAGCEPVLNPHKRKLTEEEVLKLLLEVRPVGMIAGVEPLTARVLEKAEGLKVISRCGIGLDNVDLAAAKRLGIEVLSTPDAPTLAVAELAVALMLAVLRRVPAVDGAIRSGKWSRPMGRLLSEKTVGIIGCGRIGSSVAGLLAGFRCRLLGYDPHIASHPVIHMTGLESLLRDSDIISIHVPYSKETHNLINSENIRTLKRGAIIINTSRGGIVEEAALCKALNEGMLGGVGIDCFEKEPYEGDLAKCEQAVLTCHIGSYAAESRVQMEREAADNLLNALKGEGARQ